MKYRKLRIAWSVAWGLACVLLIVLWVRSYWWFDHVFITQCWGEKTTIWVEQKFGGIRVTLISQLLPSSNRAIWHQSQRLGDDESPYPTKNVFGFGIRRFGEETGEPGFYLFAPHWFYVSIIAFVAAAPWLPFWFNRFSLRTLLIALRKLRIAFSATCLIACVLLIMLWVRSYRTVDVVDVRQLWGNDVTIVDGNAFVNDRLIPTIIDSGNRPIVVAVPAGEGFKVRLWLPTLLAATLSIIPWLPRRFSLRTLLIATTLVAVVLGGFGVCVTHCRRPRL